MNALFDNELEWELLGAMVDQPACLPGVFRNCSASDFDSEGTRKVFEAIQSIFERGATPDAFIVRDELRDQDLVMRLLDSARERIIVAGNAPFHALRVHALAQLRQVVAVGLSMADIDDTDDPATVIATANEKLRSAGISVPSSDLTPRELTNRSMDEIDENSQIHAAVATGLPSVDRVLDGGLLPSRVYVLGARTGVGKSALATCITRHALDAGHRTLFCSLEMTPREVWTRLAAEKYDLNHRDVSGLVNAWISNHMLGWPLHFMELATMPTLAGKIRELKPQGLSLVVLDYIQLLPSSGKFERRDLEIGYMMRSLKLLAMETKLPFLILAQLNRQSATDDPPRISHLRESGNLEQDANVVLLLHRLNESSDPDKLREARLSIAKNRHGGVGAVELGYRPERTQFYERP